MGVTKTFHLILPIVFSVISLFSYQYEQQRASTLASQSLQDYVQNPLWQTSLPHDGNALYERLSPDYHFKFFQYIHQLVGTLNHTSGQLHPVNDDMIAALFSQDLSNTRVLPQGRLQVKLDDSHIRIEAKQRFIKTLSVIWLTYLVIALLFSILMVRLNRAIRYASNYIDTLSELKFDALAQSAFRGELAPLGQALEKCRVSLNSKYNEIQQHNTKLNKQAYQDPVTLFSTRAKFTEKLDSLAQPGTHFGVMAIIKATELGQINRSQGREAGDDYLAGVADCIRTSIQALAQAECFRISSADFALFIPDITLKNAQPLLRNLKANFDLFQQKIDVESVAYIGLVPYQQGNQALSLVYLGDAAVSIAQTMGPNSFHIQEQLNGDELFGDSKWKTAIDDIIKRRAVKFHAQDIQPCRGADKVYRELLARFYSSQGKFLPTATVIAMAERHGMSVELDKMIILSTFKLLIDNPSLPGAFGINISSNSMTQPAFIAWIKTLFVRQRQIACRIVLEVNEAGMQANINQAHKFVREMHGVGARVAVEHFGMGFTSFKFFKEVRPDFIKLDGSYTLDIESDHNRFFVKMIVDVARKESIGVIASSIERQEQKLILEHLLVDGLQGYYIAKPQAIVRQNEQSSVN
ncbi:EAL domain-containing protein [Shewanella algidipiscicola]|uniref:Diguanylate cyclase n=1 Tax=Shewanella algidipiscicola TaxID=614070 RepID=A0ABQ4PKX9_9GAMM|nr:diguanylate cyclase [Shewanella algidipiscicola]